MNLSLSTNLRQSFLTFDLFSECWVFRLVFFFSFDPRRGDPTFRNCLNKEARSRQYGATNVELGACCVEEEPVALPRRWGQVERLPELL